MVTKEKHSQWILVDLSSCLKGQVPSNSMRSSLMNQVGLSIRLPHLSIHFTLNASTCAFAICSNSVASEVKNAAIAELLTLHLQFRTAGAFTRSN